MKDFINFLRKQGVVGLAVAFILGGSVSQVVSSLVDDIISPIIGVILGFAGGLQSAVLVIGPVQIRWGNFTSVVLDFLVVAAVVYFGVKSLGLEKLDKEE